MHEDSLYCDVHYGLHSGSGVAGTHDLMPPGPLTPGGPVGPPFVPDPMGHSPNYLNFPPIPGGFPGGPPPCSDPTSNAGNGGWYPPASASDFPPGLGGPGGDFQYDNNNVNDPIMKKRRGRKKRKVETFAAMNGYLEAAGGYPPGMDGQGGPGKTKRARTSFKHHQLRIMKHHFNINQNPDSRELKILSQKTGLDKKVLQVKSITGKYTFFIKSKLVLDLMIINTHFRFGFKMLEPNGGEQGHKRVIVIQVDQLKEQEQATWELTKATF